MELHGVMRHLEFLADPEAVKGMARYGIRPERTLGVSVATLRGLAREIGTDHDLARALWETGVRDARLLATLTADPLLMTPELLDRWARGLDSWDVCDGYCANLVRRTKDPHLTALGWSLQEGEFVKRAGFSLMAILAVHWKHAGDHEFDPFIEAILRESGDPRNLVKKAVNWALRSIGKRNHALNQRALDTAERIRTTGTRSGRWIAADALRELTSPGVRERLRRKERGEREKGKGGECEGREGAVE